jgi:hypothetical protein
MALTPKETARLAMMDRLIPIIKPYFDHAKVTAQTNPESLDISSIVLLLVVDDLKDEYQDLKARQ